ncbi:MULTISPECIES: hypothetical protein [Aminobacter]|uniref:Uncharacterized protein n=1 Tax=Aminobacter ciceronei TaxID=150723 RepID=A0ABR6C539_9HYPH|nr:MULTISPECIES: hypothetical protein [Aminobacter]MBA8906315.1 hypothetical protein [Aminobacter ciceronei]MBA9020094.1 hypothetical protein [Aminobacter ciceronei]
MAEHPLGRSPDVKTLAMHHNGKFVGETRAGQYLRGIGKDRHHWHVLGLCSLQPDRAYSCLIAFGAWRNDAAGTFVSKFSRQSETETAFAR